MNGASYYGIDHYARRQSIRLINKWCTTQTTILEDHSHESLSGVITNHDPDPEGKQLNTKPFSLCSVSFLAGKGSSKVLLHLKGITGCVDTLRNNL
jgi:hypothetical protein